MKLKTKSRPQKAAVNAESSTATLCPQNDLVYHSDDSGVLLVGDISTTNCETRQPVARTCTKDLGEFKRFKSQSSGSSGSVQTAPTKPHIHHKGTSQATCTYSTHRLQFSQLENSNNHRRLQLGDKLSDGKPIT